MPIPGGVNDHCKHPTNAEHYFTLIYLTYYYKLYKKLEGLSNRVDVLLLNVQEILYKILRYVNLRGCFCIEVTFSSVELVN